MKTYHITPLNSHNIIQDQPEYHTRPTITDFSTIERPHHRSSCTQYHTRSTSAFRAISDFSTVRKNCKTTHNIMQDQPVHSRLLMISQQYVRPHQCNSHNITQDQPVHSRLSMISLKYARTHHCNSHNILQDQPVHSRLYCKWFLYSM